MAKTKFTLSRWSKSDKKDLKNCPACDKPLCPGEFSSHQCEAHPSKFLGGKKTNKIINKEMTKTDDDEPQPQEGSDDSVIILESETAEASNRNQPNANSGASNAQFCPPEYQRSRRGCGWTMPPIPSSQGQSPPTTFSKGQDTIPPTCQQGKLQTKPIFSSPDLLPPLDAPYGLTGENVTPPPPAHQWYSQVVVDMPGSPPLIGPDHCLGTQGIGQGNIRKNTTIVPMIPAYWARPFDAPYGRTGEEMTMTPPPAHQGKKVFPQAWVTEIPLYWGRPFDAPYGLTRQEMNKTPPPAHQGNVFPQAGVAESPLYWAIPLATSTPIPPARAYQQYTFGN